MNSLPSNDNDYDSKKNKRKDHSTDYERDNHHRSSKKHRRSSPSTIYSSNRHRSSSKQQQQHRRRSSSSSSRSSENPSHHSPNDHDEHSNRKLTKGTLGSELDKLRLKTPGQNKTVPTTTTTIITENPPVHIEHDRSTGNRSE